MYNPHMTSADQARERMVFLGGRASNGIRLASFMYVIARARYKFGTLSRLEKEELCRNYLIVDKTIQMYVTEEL
jgi:hypothetical protein